jgi:hypothetical protein
MYSGSSSRLGSFTMPERASFETRYWSTSHSSALRLPRRSFVNLQRNTGQGEELVIAQFGFVL